MKSARLIFLILLVGVTASIWYAVFHSQNKNELKIVMLNIGQGDSIYIEAPNGNQMIIDGGPNSSILNELGTIVPFYDRSIDILMITNPDKDHFAGFIDVLGGFAVDQVIESGTKPGTEIYATFEKWADEKKIQKISARRGMKIYLDDEVVFTVLFPDRDVSGLATNQGSIVGKLTYGSTSVMFTGDTTKEIEEYLVSLDGEGLDSDVLKVAHHGSDTSTSEDFVKAVSPEIALISAGVDNKYGHPRKKTLDTLKKFGVQVFGTYEKGRITLVSDGKSIHTK